MRIKEGLVDTEKICFGDKEYPAWHIHFGGREYWFSTIELEEKLITEDGDYTSPEAKIVDDDIYYYLDEEERQDTSYEALLDYAGLKKRENVIYVVRTNNDNPFAGCDFIYFIDKAKAYAEFEKRCREFHSQWNLPEEAVLNCLKLNYMEVGQICDFYKLDGGTDDDFCTLEEIPLGEWLDTQEISTYFDYNDVDVILEERGLK